MANKSFWQYRQIPNPADFTPPCDVCGSPGVCLMPLEVDHIQRAVIATYRCENGHKWTREFRPQPEDGAFVLNCRRGA
jgi:hypothetical protein